MTKILRALAVWLALISPLHAQGSGQLGAGQVWGNPTAARALASPATISAMLDRAASSAQGSMLTRTAAGWVALAPGTAGRPLVSAGAGADLAYAVLGLSGGGTNASLTASNGGIFYSTASAAAILSGTATAAQMLQSGASAAPAWSTATWPATAAAGTMLNAGSANVWSATATPTLGVPTSLLGTLTLAGNTSGSVLITPQATAGSPTLTLPNTSGTFVVTATAPLTRSATTGAISITGAVGQVLAGATPAFTSTPVLGASGTLGTLGFGNATSGTVTLQPVAGALGAAVLTMPAATDTLAVLAAAQAFTNKTYNGNTWTAGTGTLTLAASKTFTASNSITLAGTDGTTWTGPSTNATLAALNIAAQTLSGGANVTAGNLGTVSSGTTTINCGTVPLQFLTNGGAFTLAAPANDGSCVVMSTNNGSAGTITFSGFTVGSSVGDALTTTNTSKFSIHIWRINSVAGYRVAAHQ